MRGADDGPVAILARLIARTPKGSLGIFGDIDGMKKRLNAVPLH